MTKIKNGNIDKMWKWTGRVLQLYPFELYQQTQIKYLFLHLVPQFQFTCQYQAPPSSSEAGSST